MTMGGKLPDLDIADLEIGNADDSDEVIVALRTVQQSQVRLNILADQKANINIGFTLLFITLSQSPIVLDSVTTSILRWGLVGITVMVATSLTLALMVVFPRTGGARIQKPEQMVNPFYFGMFSQLEQQSYVDYMLENLNHNQQARRMLLVDIYQIGRVLKRKYRLLRFSYGFLALSAISSTLLLTYRTLGS
jgi:hypothetical protein